MDPSVAVTAHAGKIALAISSAARSSRNEAEFRSRFSQVVRDFAAECGIPLEVREEYTLANGRLDAAYNRLVIEYEPPGSLRANPSHRHTAHAVQQVKDYLLGIAAKDRKKIHRLAGVAVDGHFFVFVRHVGGQFVVERPVEVNEFTTTRFLRLLVSLTSGKALLPENLIADFGSQTDTAKRVARSLYGALGRALREEPDGIVAKLFGQWQTFYGEVTGFGRGSTQVKHKSELREFAKGMGVSPDDLDTSLLFFTVHTYFSLLVKLIAYLALSRFVSGFGTRFGSLYSLDDNDLAKEMGELERGGLFRRIGIRNVLEGDFFRWYLAVWDEELAGAVRQLAMGLREYDPGTLEVNPEAARDLLKKLYHYLMPRELRHDLGEYYTPDWLAERLLNQLGYDGDPKKRILDPSCGSGTFLVLAIRRLKERCLLREGMNEQQTLKVVLGAIAGIDLNPLAVIAARTNFLLALHDILEHRTEDIDIPVYLADSIMSPEAGQGLFGKDRYQIKTTVGIFEIPSALRSRRQVEGLTNLLSESIEAGVSPESFLFRAEQQLGLQPDRWAGSDGKGEAARSLLERLYGKLVDLHGRGLDGIWTGIIKNYFMPLFMGRFDLIAGNPPWVIWDNLPSDYRDETKPIWMAHGLFPHGGMDALLGKGKKDISMLMTYEVADTLLRRGGRLGFVITQSVFKTAGSGQGFRRFTLRGGDTIAPLHVDDMVDFQPFEGASNRTTVLIVQKGGRLRERVPYTVWQKTGRGQRIGYDLSLDEVSAMTRRLQYVAEPVRESDRTSAWLTARPRTITVLRKILGPSAYQAHAGAYSGGANGVYWVEVLEWRKDGMAVVRNLTAGSKREVDEVQAVIEPDFLYPLLRGKDVKEWSADPSAQILLVQDPSTRRGVEKEFLQRECPRTWAYFKQFESVLKARKDRGTRQIVEQGGAFYSMFGVGEYTVAAHKVVWGRIGSSIHADAIGSKDGKPIIPQETHSLIAVESKEEALYVAAVMNSLPFNFATVSYSQAGGKSFGSPHILENVKVPKFDAHAKHCRELARLAAVAKKAASSGDGARLSAARADIDATSLQVWGLTEGDLNEITRGYFEITKADLEAKRMPA